MRRELQQTMPVQSRFKSAFAVVEVVLFALAFTAIFTLIVQAHSTSL